MIPAKRKDRLSVRFTSVGEASAARSALEAAGIPAALENEHITGVAPHGALAYGGVGLVVPEGMCEQAEAILAETATRADDLEAEGPDAVDLPRSMERDASELDHFKFDRLLARATAGSIVATFLFPLIGNALASGLYVQAYRMNPARFRSRLGRVALGMAFNALGCGAVLALLAIR